MTTWINPDERPDPNALHDPATFCACSIPASVSKLETDAPTRVPPDTSPSKPMSRPPTARPNWLPRSKFRDSENSLPMER